MIQIDSFFDVVLESAVRPQSPELTDDLKAVCVRPMMEAEKERWERLMEEHHYLKWPGPVGESLGYVVTLKGKWLALVAFGSAAYALKDRDQWIGWSVEQRRCRLNFITQNRRFLILPGIKTPNLASRILGLTIWRLSSDWEEKYGHPVLGVETFVDPQRFEGTCYRAAGWNRLGMSGGFGRTRRDFYVEHEHPKELWVKALRKDAVEKLRLKDWPEVWRDHEIEGLPSSPIRTEESRSLFEAFRKVPEYRRKHGMRHPMASILACATCATLAGAKKLAVKMVMQTL